MSSHILHCAEGTLLSRTGISLAAPARDDEQECAVKLDLLAIIAYVFQSINALPLATTSQFAPAHSTQRSTIAGNANQASALAAKG